jgi:phosphoesterase RecJ-like protein
MILSPRNALTPEQARALELMRLGERFLLAGHVRPDGDCLGAQAALSRVLQALGKHAVILNPDAPGTRFDYFTDACPFGVYEGGELPAHDVCVLLDINDLSRCGALEEPIRQARSRKVVVDHHPRHGEAWWDAAFVDVGAAATGVLVHRIARALDAPLDDVAAKALFTSLVTDTGWLRYSNTDAETMALAAELVAGGIVPNEVHRALYERNEMGRPKVLSELLGGARYFADGRVALIEQRLSDSAPPDFDGSLLIDILRSVATVEVVLYLRELQGGGCKLSARSKELVDVDRLARRFGGGGHARAAGATLEGDVATVADRLVDAAIRDLEAAGRGAR